MTLLSQPHLKTKAYDVIVKDHYVDDCLSGAPSIQEAHALMDEVELVFGLRWAHIKNIHSLR